MQAYATTETAAPAELRVFDERRVRPDAPGAVATPGKAVLDELLGQLVELVAERVATKLLAPTGVENEWLDTRRAAEYLGVHRDGLRRLAAEGVIPAEQAGAGCKLYFRRSDLDAWRSPGSAPVVSIGGWRDA
jgi:excisionase family DNA binding protein